MKKPVVLRIYKGDQLLGVKQFLESQIVIGRQGEIQVALEGEQVAFIHAAIEERESGYYLCDLGSETGTFKNGEPVLDAAIESGDILQIGEYRIEFYIGVPKPRTIPPATAASVQAPSVLTPSAAVDPVAVTVAPPAEVIREVTPPPVAPVEPVTPPVAPTIVSTPVQEAAPTASGETAAIAAVSEPVVMAPAVTVPPVAPAVPVATAAPMMDAGVMAGPASFGLSGPKARVAPGIARKRLEYKKKKKKGLKTFAPASRFTNIKDFVKPSKGTVVEVLVAWRERVIGSYHFAHRKTITIGSHPDNDIVLPVFSSRVRKLPILRIESQAIALVTPEMTGELVRGQASSSFAELLRSNRLIKEKNSYAVGIDQGEMIKIDLGDQISVIIRYVSDSPKPLVAPLLDLTASEFTGVVLAAALVVALYLFTMFHEPPKALVEEGDTEPMRTAMIIVAPPTPPPLPPPPPPQPEAPQPPPPKVEEPPPQPVKVKVAEKKQENPKPARHKAVTNLTKKNDPGVSASAAPNKNKTGPRAVTSPKQGGAIKTSDKEGSQMQSKSKDPSKSGIFSVFGPGGAQDQLAQSTSGAGELAGMAGASSGKAGFAQNRPGQGLGSELKDTGQGGNGKALEGIAGGVGTTGRGSGNTGYGTGGLGDRQGVKIVTGGSEESFSGTIDKEAIRRVIMANLKVIRTCYERQLNRNPDLFGKLILSWDIGEQGRVLATRVKSNELGNKEVADCIMDRLKTWRFPEPPTNQVVEVEAYPFFFSN